jgi:hypothetical protein
MPTFIAIFALSFAVAVPLPAKQPSGLIGNWTVDLRPSPKSPAHPKPMVLSIAADGSLTGEFYEHAIEKGRAGATNGHDCFAFHTSDQSGPYQTSGCLVGNQINGQTWSEGRDFILVWSAVHASK